MKAPRLANGQVVLLALVIFAGSPALASQGEQSRADADAAAACSQRSGGEKRIWKARNHHWNYLDG